MSQYQVTYHPTGQIEELPTHDFWADDYDAALEEVARLIRTAPHPKVIAVTAAVSEDVIEDEDALEQTWTLKGGALISLVEQADL